jgi:hypothetical protein
MCPHPDTKPIIVYIKKRLRKKGRTMLLVENDNKQKQEPNEEIDRFSSFMLGNSKHRETYKKGEYNSQELPADSTTNRTDNWFFSFRRIEPASSTHTTLNHIENLLNNVDFELCMETIDMFSTTSEQLKPLLKEITPFTQRFSKKFKSTKNA